VGMHTIDATGPGATTTSKFNLVRQ
jgi:hypothetical protein